MSISVASSAYPFTFDNSACASCKGHCCRGDQGYIWVTLDNIEAIAKARNVTVNELAENYIRRVGTRYSLQERYENKEYLCCFLDAESGQCQIYNERPEQCRSYPYWPAYAEDTEQVVKLFEECPGVSLGSLK